MIVSPILRFQENTIIKKTVFCAVVTAAVLAFAGCMPQEDLRIGFIGGLTGSNSDNGQAGLNGVILAVEKINQAGGVNGRKIDLLIKDDAQQPGVAEKSARELVSAHVEAVIGPFTSSMASRIVPSTGAAGVLQISPTVTAMEFYGKDDNFFRINRTTRDNAREYAQVITGRGQSRVSVAYDLGNKSFTESWLQEFSTYIAAQGGEIVIVVPYSSPSVDYEGVVRSMLNAKPDIAFFIAGALDVARLAQQVKKINPSIPIGAAEWAGTEQLLEFGGDVVEGLLIVQNHNSADNSEKFRVFAESYFRRFQRIPGYSSVAAYDAATVVLNALKHQKKNETLKSTVLRLQRFECLQQEIVFDKNGDTERKVFFTEVRSGRFVQIK